MGVLDYDCKSWTESGMFLGMAVGYVAISLAGIREYRRSRAANLLPSNKRLFLWYFVLVEIGLAFRLGYLLSGSHFIPFPTPLYGLFSTFPGLIFATACLFFMEFMLNSFYFNLGSARNNIRLAINMFLTVFWPTELAMYVGVVYQHYHPSAINWYTILYFVAFAMYVTATSLLIFLFVVYIRNIKKFPHTYRDKRCILLAMLIMTTVQITYRVVHIILDNIQVYTAFQKACAGSGVPCMHLVYDCYFVLCDVSLPILYTIYIRKDIQHLAMSEQGLLHTPKTVHKPNYPAILESWIANLPQSFPDPNPHDLSVPYSIAT